MSDTDQAPPAAVEDDDDAPDTVIAIPLPVVYITSAVLVAGVILLPLLGIHSLVALLPAAVTLLVLQRRVPFCPLPPLRVETYKDVDRERDFRAWHAEHGVALTFGHPERFAAASKRRQKGTPIP